MADDQNQRPYRSNEPPARAAPAASPGAASDPLAELARLIGQTDPFAEFGRDNARRARPRPMAARRPAEHRRRSRTKLRRRRPRMAPSAQHPSYAASADSIARSAVSG